MGILLADNKKSYSLKLNLCVPRNASWPLPRHKYKWDCESYSDFGGTQSFWHFEQIIWLYVVLNDYLATVWSWFVEICEIRKVLSKL